MNKKAFSLIELSVVLLIIGILIAGVTQSSRLIDEFNLKTAQNLTLGSPVNSIKDLALWYETSLDASLNDAEREDEEPVTNWYSVNPQTSFPNTATQATLANKPTFRRKVFHSIPAISFDGDNDFMNFDGSFLIKTDYTIFVVEQRRLGVEKNFFITGTGTDPNSNLSIGYNDVNEIGQLHGDNNLIENIDDYSVPIPKIHTFNFSSVRGKSYWLNGGETADFTEPTQTAPLESFPGSALAGSDSLYYNGDIAEIIIFTRSLKTEERRSIEEYLSKKYKILIS